MKKTYINPTMDVVRLQTSVQMMAGSPTAGFEPSENTETQEGRGSDLDDEF